MQVLIFYTGQAFWLTGQNKIQNLNCRLVPYWLCVKKLGEVN